MIILYVALLVATCLNVSNGETCEFCADGLPPNKPELDLAPIIQQPNIESLTCTQVDESRLSFEEGTVECSQIKLIKGLCECPTESTSEQAEIGDQDEGDQQQQPNKGAEEEEDQQPDKPGVNEEDQQQQERNACRMCDRNLPEPHRELNGWSRYGIPEGTTCAQMDDIIAITYNDGSTNCKTSHDNIGFSCGCVEDFVYLGAETELQKAVLTWLPVFTGILSTCGSLYIIWSISRPRRGFRFLRVRDQFLLGMSTFDLFSSIAGSFSTFATPEIINFGEKSGIYGASGNDATCTAQGFFVVLGHTSLYYNMLLAIFYLLTVRYGWTESKARCFSKYFHMIPLCGIAGAFIGIPHIKNVYLGCSIAPPPIGDKKWPVWGLIIIPISLALSVATVSVGLVYEAFHRQRRQSRRWRFPRSNFPSNEPTTSSPGALDTISTETSMSRLESSARVNHRTRISIERDFFLQSLSYLIALYISFSVVLSMNLTVLLGGVDAIITIPYGVTVYVALVGNLQGFSNFIVYTRPRVIAWRRTSKTKAQDKRRQSNGNNEDVNPVECSLGLEPVMQNQSGLASSDLNKPEVDEDHHEGDNSF